MHDIVFIHGAYHTPSSFNYIKERLQKNKKCPTFHDVQYNTQTLESLSTAALRLSSSINNDACVVGHSMGGLIALGVGFNDHVKSVITLASPIAGLKYNWVTQQYLIYNTPVLKDVMKGSDYLKKMHMFYESGIGDLIDITHINAVKGFNPILWEENDGVVPLTSQRDWSAPFSTIKEIETSHHEILMSDEVAELIYKKAMES